VELLRGRAATVEAAMAEIQSVLSLPSGYQRDLQLTKAPLIRGMTCSLQALAIVPDMVGGLALRETVMSEAISVEMYTTDLALEKAASGVPFRTAYLEAKSQLDAVETPDVAASLAQRVSPGGCGNLLLDRIRERLEQQRSLILEKKPI
jgi:argininosuccinate lyase